MKRGRAQIMNFNYLTKITTRHSLLQEIKESDLTSLIQLRTNRRDSYLNPIAPTIESQISYFKLYKELRAQRSEIYYKIADINSPFQMIGLVRLTELHSAEMFSWESFILEDTVAPYIALDVMMTLYRLGFEKLGRLCCGPWTVPIQATQICRLHTKVAMADIISTDENYFYMSVSRAKFFEKYPFFKRLGYGLYDF